MPWWWPLQVPCKRECGELVKVCDMDVHLARLCKLRPVFCPNHCGVCLPEVDLVEHAK